MSTSENKLSSIHSLTEAIAMTIDESGLAREEIAVRLGIPLGHLTRMLNEHDNRYFPPDLIGSVMEECNSILPLEWLTWKMGYMLSEMSTREILEAIRDALETEKMPV